MKELNVKDLNINPADLIGNKWMLVSAGKENNYNTMTASWGEIGALWGHGLYGRPTFTIFIRPSRYTDKFIDGNDCYSLCFFEEEYRKDLSYLGSHSGKDEDKVSKTNLHVDFIDDIPFFKEANLVFVCKKIYKGKIEKEGFIDKSIIDNFYKDASDHAYNNSSFHNVYVGEILKIYVK